MRGRWGDQSVQTTATSMSVIHTYICMYVRALYSSKPADVSLAIQTGFFRYSRICLHVISFTYIHI